MPQQTRRRRRVLTAIVVVLETWAAAEPSIAAGYSVARPYNKYANGEIAFDYIVMFKVPKGSRNITVYARSTRALATLRKSDVSNEGTHGSWTHIKVVAGYGARVSASPKYLTRAAVHQFANDLEVRYRPR